ncbi:MAG: hypothetical protein RLZZ370_214 [Bacteroidota bacterium]|jgi:gliding motility-associated-like protein
MKTTFWKRSLRAGILCAASLYVGLLQAATVYVDVVSGNDAWNGQQGTFMGGTTGPKKTINAALRIAAPNDNIYLADGSYNESVRITKSLVFQFSNVQVRTLWMDTAGVTLNLVGSTFKVRDSLVLTNGKVDASSPLLQFIVQVSGRIIGGSSNSYVDGRLYIENALTSGATLFYPVGDKTDYRPMLITFNQNVMATTAYGVRVYASAAPAGPLPPGIKNISLVHYWELSKIGLAVPSSIFPTLNYDDTTNNDEVFQTAKLRVAYRKVGWPWQNLGGVGSGTPTGAITATTAADSVGYFTLANTTDGFNPLGARFPFAHFGWNGKCEKTDIQFLDSSATFPGTLTRWHWNFGVPFRTDDTSNLQNPVFRFPGTGPYTVTLVVFNSLGRSDTAKRVISLLRAPVANFSAGNVCLGDSINFKDLSVVFGTDSIVARNWDLGDGFTTSLKNFTYTYGAPGTYDVVLSVTSSAGCSNSLLRKVNVYAIPTPDFTFSNVCKGDTLKLESIQAPGDSLVGFNWYVGNTFFSNKKNTQRFFPNEGTYDIKLEVRSLQGCVDSVRKNVTIFRAPIASFALTPGLPGNDSMQCFPGNNFKFTDYSQNFQGQGLDGWFYWGDGTQSYFTNKSKSYLNSGTKVVKLLLETKNGCKDSITRVYIVKARVYAGFRVNAPCFPQITEFRDSASTSASPIVSRTWDFGDMNGGSGDSVDHQYMSAGSYSVLYVVTSAEGCADSMRQQITIAATPTIAITAGSNNPFCFGDTLLVDVTGGTSVMWMHDNQTMRTRQFWTPGLYRVRAYNGPQCFVEDSVLVKRYPAPVVSAGTDTILVKGRFISLNGSGGKTYSWKPASALDNPGVQNPKSRPLVPTTFYLEATDSNGCIGYDTVFVDITEPGFIRIPNLITPNGDQKNDLWDLKELPMADLCSVRIYNNQGILVFSASNYNNDWDGTFRGTKLPEGVYFYQLDCPFEPEPYKGYVQIIR